MKGYWMFGLGMMVLAICVCGFVISDESDAAGSGTQSDPFNGSYTADCVEVAYEFPSNRTAYINTGTNVDISSYDDGELYSYVCRKLRRCGNG